MLTLFSPTLLTSMHNERTNFTVLCLLSAESLVCSSLSRMPVTKNLFRVYRVLGKGGFGLVRLGEVIRRGA